MKEQPRHIKAFEYYVSMDKRSLAKVSQKFNVSVQSLIKWSKAFGWKERIKDRDKNISAELAKQTDKTIVKTKAQLQTEVGQIADLIRAALAQIAKKVKAGSIKADTSKDLGTLVAAYDRTVRLGEELKGETLGNKPVNINLIGLDPAPRPVEDGGYYGPIDKFKADFKKAVESKEIE